MSLLSAVGDSFRVTADLARHGIDRVRLEAKLKGLQREETNALTALGRRVRELTISGELTDERLTTEVAEVAAAEMRIAACEAEIEEILSGATPKTDANAEEDAAKASADGADDGTATPPSEEPTVAIAPSSSDASDGSDALAPDSTAPPAGDASTESEADADGPADGDGTAAG